MTSKKICQGLFLAALALPVFASETSRPQDETEFNTNEAAIAALRNKVVHILQQHPAVLAADSAVSAFDAEHKAAEQSRHNPALTMETESAAENTTTIGLSQTIDWNGKRDAAVDVAAREYQVAAAGLIVTRRRVTVEILNALAEFEKTRSIEQLSTQRASLMKRIAETVAQRQSAGDLGQWDQALARVAYSEASMQQVIAAAEFADAKVALNALTGDADQHPPPVLPKHPPAAIAIADIETLLDQIPELAVARNQIDATQARVEVAKRARQPDPTLSVRGGREGTDTLVALSVEVPLFVRNPMTAPVQVAQYRAVEQTQTYLELRRQARARLNAALVRYRLTAQAWETWAVEGRASLKEQVNLAERLWQAGELSAADYLFQAKQIVDTQLTAVELEGRVWQATIAYLDASGRIDQWLGLDRDVTNSRSGATP